MVYAFTNPTATDLVHRVEDWPGANSFQATLSGAHFVARVPLTSSETMATCQTSSTCQFTAHMASRSFPPTSCPKMVT